MLRVLLAMAPFALLIEAQVSVAHAQVTTPCGQNTSANSACPETSDGREQISQRTSQIRRLHVIVILCAVTVVTDFLCVAIWQVRCTSATDIFLLSMSVYDLANSVFKIIESMLDLYQKSLSHFIIWQSVLGNLNSITFHGMTFSNLALVVERHLRVVSPRPHRKERRDAKIIVILILFVLVVLALPNAVLYSVYGEEISYPYIYHRFVIIAFRLVPWLFITIFNVLILVNVWKRRHTTTKGFMQSAGSRILLCITIQTIASIITYPLAQIWRLTYLFSPGTTQHSRAFYIIFIFQQQHHIVNFVAYFLLFKEFRTVLWNLLFHCRFSNNPRLDCQSHVPQITLQEEGIQPRTKSAGTSTFAAELRGKNTLNVKSTGAATVEAGLRGGDTLNVKSTGAATVEAGFRGGDTLYVKSTGAATVKAGLRDEHSPSPNPTKETQPGTERVGERD